MLLNDGVRDRQSESGALADVLRREEGIEDLVLDVRRHARPVIADLQHDRVLFAVMPRPQHQRAAPIGRQHGLLSVDHKVQQHLLNLMRVGEDRWQPRRQCRDDIDVGQALLVGTQRQRLADDLVQIDHRARGLALSREREQISHDPGGTLRLTEDDVDASPGRLVEVPLGQTLGPAEDGGERVVQFVRDTGDGLAESGHLFRLQQLLIEVAGLVVQPTALADVAHEDFDVGGPAAARRRRMSRHFHPNQIAVEPPQTQQVVRHGAFGKEAADERDARGRIHESVGGKGGDGFVGGVRGVSKDRFQMRIDGASVSVRQRISRQRTDIDTFVDGLKQTRECVRAGSLGNSFRCRHHGNYRPPCAALCAAHQ